MSSMSYGVPPQLLELVAFQAGVLTADQAASGGLGKEQVKSRVRRGHWLRIYRGVYSTSSGVPSREALLWAAVLSAGPGAMLSHQTAAELHKLTDDVSELIHVTIPADRRICRQPGIVIHFSRRAAQAVHPAQTPPRTRVEETILDLAAAAASIDDAVSWVVRGLGRRLTNAARLRAAMTQRTFVPWRRQLTELLTDDLSGLHSLLEYRYVRDVERPHGLPRGQRQVKVRQCGRIQYRDVLYDEFQLAVEVDGQLAHPPETRRRDAQRDNAAALGGITTFRYGWLDVTRHPCQVAAEIAALLSRRGYLGARPCSPGCPVGRPAGQGQDLRARPMATEANGAGS
jgi:hypothetical protein